MFWGLLGSSHVHHVQTSLENMVFLVCGFNQSKPHIQQKRFVRGQQKTILISDHVILYPQNQ